MAAWIARERKRLGLTPADLVARLEALGLEASEQTVRVWESYANRRPSVDNIDGLERIFRTRSPDRDEGPADQTAVVAAIDRQTKAIEDLTAAIWAALGDRPNSESGLPAVLEDMRAATKSGVREGIRRAGIPEPRDPEAPARTPERLPRDNGRRS